MLVSCQWECALAAATVIWTACRWFTPKWRWRSYFTLCIHEWNLADPMAVRYNLPLLFLHWLDSAFVSKWSHTRKTGKSPKQYYVICWIVIMLQQLKFGNLLSCSISYDMFQKYISIYGVKWCYCLATLDRPNHCLWKS